MRISSYITIEKASRSTLISPPKEAGSSASFNNQDTHIERPYTPTIIKDLNEYDVVGYKQTSNGVSLIIAFGIEYVEFAEYGFDNEIGAWRRQASEAVGLNNEYGYLPDESVKPIDAHV